MQTKIDAFYKSNSIPTNNNNKKCFIYDPLYYKATFENNHGENDIFLTTKLGVKLYYRRPFVNKPLLIPKIQHESNIPLLKSNLQKAIRRGNVDVSISSALAILQIKPIELLRRLPIIYIEDVCLMDSYSIVVWLMMAENEHNIDFNDIDILLHIVKNLCECSLYYDNSIDHNFDMILTHNNLKNCDQVLSLYYRSQYGGMKGDMKMLTNSIYYYYHHSDEIIVTSYDNINYSEIKPVLVILPEAIDFHPFPKMLTTLENQTNIDQDTIKKYIWFIESGLNIRKPKTIENSEMYINSTNWNVIKIKLSSVRERLILYKQHF
jgi:hypothetical protein